MLKKYRKKAEQILSFAEKLTLWDDCDFPCRTKELMEKRKTGESLEGMMIEAFAMVVEASRRTLGMEHYPVQLIGGMVLHEGKIAEMATGEGKTLVATLPAYLNALDGKGVHVVTVNDYLAKRDAEQMGKIYQYLGLTVGVVVPEMDTAERQKAYQCDITYITNSEAGFDYLRDNMVKDPKNIVQRGLHYAIIDEVDSILIDEARTPLIIAGKKDTEINIYGECDAFIKSLKRGNDELVRQMEDSPTKEILEDGDYLVDEKGKRAWLTQDGIRKAEERFHVENLYQMDNIVLQHHLDIALRANTIMKKDIDYMIRDDEILIIDEFTGRIMEGRRFNDNLHQAIEAKENVTIHEDSSTHASVTYQCFFNKYEKKSGMTGTAKTDALELKKIYQMAVQVIPTNKLKIRKDEDDSIYATKEDKYKAVIKDIQSCYEKGQPVLVGTGDVETSEYLSDLLEKEGLIHQVLNAKFHEIEADIVSHAGEKGSITIATNMAGRGTDIVLEEGVAELGGLRVIGTQRHENRRIDNQLRGRAGRQGDPGSSKFYISMEDDLLKQYLPKKLIEHIKKIYESNEIHDAITGKRLSKNVRKAQKLLESKNYSIRKNVLDYDLVNNEIRELFYHQRKEIFELDVWDIINNLFKTTLTEMFESCYQGIFMKKWNMEVIQPYYYHLFGVNCRIPTEEEIKKGNPYNYIEALAHEVFEGFMKKVEDKAKTSMENNSSDKTDTEKKQDAMEQLSRYYRNVILEVADQYWLEYMNDAEQLKQGISHYGYGGKDPVVYYKEKAYTLYGKSLIGIHLETVGYMMHL